MPVSTSRRRLSAGVELLTIGGADISVWAPACQRVEFVIDGGPSHLLTAGADGFFRSQVSAVGAGTRYWFRLDGDRHSGRGERGGLV